MYIKTVLIKGQTSTKSPAEISCSVYTLMAMIMCILFYFILHFIFILVTHAMKRVYVLSRSENRLVRLQFFKTAGLLTAVLFNCTLFCKS